MADPSRRFARATRAFVDRAPIDWNTLLAQGGRSTDRVLIENLRAVAAIRDAGRRSTHVSQPRRFPLTAARSIVALATLESAAIVVVLTTALASGAALVDRSPQLAIAVAFGAASVPLAIAGRRDPRSLCLLAAFLCSASAFARSALAGLPDAWRAIPEQVLRGVWIEAFIPACLWQFALDFPRLPRATRFDRVARRAATAAWLLGVSLFAINMLAAYELIAPDRVSALLRDGPSRVFWQLFAAALVPPLGLIALRSWRAPAAERRRVKRFACALAGGTAPFLVSGIAWSVLPRIQPWLPDGGSFPGRWLDRLTLTALAAMPILSTTAVIVDEPIQCRDILRRDWPSALTRAALRIVQLLLFVVLASALSGYAGLAGTADRPSALAFVVVAMAGLLMAAHPGWLAAIEWQVFRGTRHRDERLACALERIRLTRGARETLSVAARELRSLLGVETVRILVAQPSGFSSAPLDGGTLSSDTVLVPMLREARTPLDLSDEGPLRQLLPQHDRSWVTANDVALVAPLTRCDGSIGALVALGRKDGGFPFNRRDRWLVASLAAAAATAWDGSLAVAGLDVSGPRPGVTGDPDVGFECGRCGAVSGSVPLECGCDGDAALASLPHRVNGQFRVVRRLGAGGMGVVYLARDERLDRDVALKTLPRVRGDAVIGLHAEARAMAALNHPSLATIYGLELWRRTPVLVVEYFARGTLADRIRQAPLSRAGVVDLGVGLARALEHMHARGLLHRDLKPTNIGFTATGAAKLLDFGLAAAMAAADTEDTAPQTAGTPAYLPPEAYRGARPSPMFDLWALAVTLLEAASGVNPFASRHLAEISRFAAVDIARFCTAHLGSEPALAAWFTRALARRPEDRFSTCADLRAALDDLA